MRTDPESGRSWTAVQELVCRCAFKAVVTTNYDPGIVDARMRVRPGASATGFMTWEDELGLDRVADRRMCSARLSCRCCSPTASTTGPTAWCWPPREYRRAYAGSCRRCWAGWWMAASGVDRVQFRRPADRRDLAGRSPTGSGTRVDPGGAPRHVAVMAWDPVAEGNDPRILASRAEIAYGAQVVLYPAPGGDHSALAVLLAGLADARFPAARTRPPALLPRQPG